MKNKSQIFFFSEWRNLQTSKRGGKKREMGKKRHIQELLKKKEAWKKGEERTQDLSA